MAEVEIRKGLVGVIADETKVSEVMPDINSLTYRGYAVQDLAETCIFEEVAYLLLNGELPNESQLIKFQEEERNNREISTSLKKVIQGERGTARSSSILFKNKEHKERYLQSCSKLIGKSSSAEINYHPYLDHDIDPILCKHIWFACAEEESIDSPSRPSIVIVVYLRYGDYGKEAAVLASDFYHEYLRIFNN